MTPDEYWQLVAFLVKKRGVQTPRVDATNARNVLLNPSAQTIPDEWIVVSAGAILFGVVGGWILWRVGRAVNRTPR
ncbi:MAG: hypothetical protein HY741_16465 [Chloroflexi bacterium]|nr:hypothetical protein [Chloroflexota bacterium]